MILLQLREQKTDLQTARGRASGVSGGKNDGFITQESRLSFSLKANCQRRAKPRNYRATKRYSAPGTKSNDY